MLYFDHKYYLTSEEENLHHVYIFFLMVGLYRFSCSLNKILIHLLLMQHVECFLCTCVTGRGKRKPSCVLVSICVKMCGLERYLCHGISLWAFEHLICRV